MDSNTLISALVDTYKDLNMKYRSSCGSDAARDILVRMRDDEIGFSQALKDHVTGIGTADSGPREQPDDDQPGISQIISQFGTARATTLNLLKGIHDPAVWDRVAEDGKSIREHVEDLAHSDRNQLERLRQVIAS